MVKVEREGEKGCRFNFSH